MAASGDEGTVTPSRHRQRTHTKHVPPCALGARPPAACPPAVRAVEEILEECHRSVGRAEVGMHVQRLAQQRACLQDPPCHDERRKQRGEGEDVV